MWGTTFGEKGQFGVYLSDNSWLDVLSEATIGETEAHRWLTRC